MEQVDRSTAQSIAHEVASEIDTLTNLMFLIDSDRSNPVLVRQYVELADHPLRVLRDLIVREFKYRM